jgi:hypothetical protein
MKYPALLTPLNAWQSVLLLQTGKTILVREYSPYGKHLPTEQPFIRFDLSMIEGRDAMRTDELYHYLLSFYEGFAIEISN